jgi:hypothetical protein
MPPASGIRADGVRNKEEGMAMRGFSGMLRRRRVGVLVAAAVVAAVVLSGGQALAAPPPEDCEDRTNSTYKKLLECVRVSEVREHQAALQAIANDNGGTREAGTSGYTESVDYVVDTLEAAGMSSWTSSISRSFHHRRWSS